MANLEQKSFHFIKYVMSFISLSIIMENEKQLCIQIEFLNALQRNKNVTKKIIIIAGFKNKNRK